MDTSYFRDWKEFETNKTVGVITTIFSEQHLEKSYKIIPLTPENYIEEIELYDIDTVFFDNDLFEADHVWYKVNRGYIINYLKKENINISVIINTTTNIHKIFKNPFVLKINSDLNNYKYVGKILEMPLLLDTDKYNPINSHKQNDVLYFSAGKLKASPETKVYNKLFNPVMHVLQDAKITRSSLRKLFSFLKLSKVLYICKSIYIDDVTLKYIEAIAYLNSTNVIFDYTYNQIHGYGFNTKNDKNNAARLRILLNSDVYNFKQALLGQREVLTNHTFIMKQDIHNVLEENVKSVTRPKISVITSTNRNQNLSFYFNQMINQQMVDIEINIVTHGFEIDEVSQNKYREQTDFTINFIFADAEESLGNCLNLAINSSDYDVITKVDDDDYYLSYYLYDQWLAMQYSEADVVGKSDGYYYFEEDDLTARRNINRYFKYDHFVMGATIMAKGKLMRRFKFSDLPKAVDSDFLRRINEKGKKIYIGHPFEMCVFRSSNNEGHTWKVNDLAMLKSSEIVSFGKPDSYVKLDKNM